MDNITIEKEKVLFVEGNDDEGFFFAFLRHLNIDDVQVISVSGKSNFGQTIKLLPKLPGFHMIRIMGFIRDADNDPKSSYDSINNFLKYNRFPSPERPGYFSSKGDLITGIFIMPGFDSSGELEDILLDTIKETKTESCLNNYFSCLNTSVSYCSKAKTLAYLASLGKTKKDCVNNIASAADKGYWDFDHKVFDGIREFLLCYAG